jgi:hypothetical protein
LDNTLEEAMNKSSLNDYLQTAAAVGAELLSNLVFKDLNQAAI